MDRKDVEPEKAAYELWRAEWERIERERTPEQRAEHARHQIKAKAERAKQRTRMASLRAKRSGKLIEPKCCENCSAESRLEMHHDDYTKPLDVRWLCKACHTQVHHGKEE